MSGTNAVAGAGSVSQLDVQDAGAQGPGAQELQQAFAQGVVEYMGVMLQSAEADIQQACADDTSDPDAPS